jgi:hypothetical protein
MVLEQQCYKDIGAFEVHLLMVSALKLSHPSACSFFQNFSHFSLLRLGVPGRREESEDAIFTISAADIERGSF